MKRKVIVFLILVLIVAGGFLAWHFFSPYNKVDMLSAIPGKPVFIIETDDSYDAWKKLTSSEVWSQLKNHPVFAKAASGMAMIDTLVQSNEKLAKYIGKRNAVISMHVTGKVTYDFIYAIDLRRMSKLLPFEKYLKGLVSKKVTIKERNYKDVKIYTVTYTVNQVVFHLCFMKNLLVASFNPQLLESSISQFDHPQLAEDKHFLEVYQKLTGEGWFRICLNYAQLDDYTNGMLSSPDPNIRQLSKSLFYTGLAFKIDDDNLIRCDGYTNFNDTLVSSLRAMMSSGTGKTGLAEVLPVQTASSVSLQFDRFTDYFDEMMKNLKEVPGSFNEYNTNIKRAESFLKINVRDNIMSWIGDEIAMVHLPPMGLGRSNEFAVFLKARDVADARKNLDYVMKQVKKRTPAKFDVVDYNGYAINYLSVKGFFKMLFGKYFQKLEKPYFIYLGDYVVFSNHPQTLKVIIDGFAKQSLLSNSKEYKSFTGNFSHKSNVFILIQTEKFLQSLQGTMNASAFSELQGNKEYITCFPYMGFQLEKEGQFFKTRFYVQFKQKAEEEEMTPEKDSIGNTDDTMAMVVTDQAKEEIAAMIKTAEEYIPDDLSKSSYMEKYPDGKIKVEIELRDGFRHGDYREYYENGETKIKGQYKKDHKEGTWKFYNISGKLLQKVKFENGKIR
jgi:hypothetical protein